MKNKVKTKPTSKHEENTVYEH